MKRFMTILVCLLSLGILSAKAQQSFIALHHDGSVTIFAGSKVRQALDASVDGDTLYLSSGIFASDFVIEKKITLIGNGVKTVIGGNVSIAPTDTTAFTCRVLQNIYINGILTIDKPANGVGISQCRLNHILFNATIDDSYIERCVFDWTNNTYINNQDAVGTFWLSPNIKGLKVISSRIANINSSCDDASACHFINCDILYIWNARNYIGYSECLATYENCIIYKWDYDNGFHNRLTTYINCLCGSNAFENSCNSGCWVNENLTYGVDEKDSRDFSLYFSDDTKLENYIGTDGTVVGCTGSKIPFTLNPATPQVLEHALEVNESGTELKVTLKVGAE